MIYSYYAIKYNKYVLDGLVQDIHTVQSAVTKLRKTVDDLETTIQSTLETCTEYQRRNKWENSQEISEKVT